MIGVWQNEEDCLNVENIDLSLALDIANKIGLLSILRVLSLAQSKKIALVHKVLLKLRIWNEVSHY